MVQPCGFLVQIVGESLEFLQMNLVLNRSLSSHSFILSSSSVKRFN
jgi:hypothetical protein